MKSLKSADLLRQILNVPEETWIQLNEPKPSAKESDGDTSPPGRATTDSNDWKDRRKLKREWESQFRLREVFLLQTLLWELGN